MTGTFEIGAEDFLLDGKPHRVLAGALHYFRVHPSEWADRIRKARLMGLNTIETYVAWNAHEPVRGQWDATGVNDLGAFLDAVAAEGMHAIVRPGPYICAEWHNGGLPAWLTALPGVELRRKNSLYLAEVETYLRRVYEIVAPRQISLGGPVVLVQIENEYGAYGSDKAYLAELVRITRDAGITVPLTTVDQPEPQMLRDGSLPGLHLTGSFGSRASERLATLREHQPTGPLMCSEFWDGWFDWWGGVHHTTSASDAANELDALLAAGASVSIYMFHGGTNFGLTNGANHKGRYLPIVTSYDYGAPLDERGDPTEKYWAFRDVISRYAPVPAESIEARPPSPEVAVALEGLGDWLPAGLGSSVESAEPLSFDSLGHAGALMYYTAELGAAAGRHRLVVGEARDRAWIEIDGVPSARLDRIESEVAASVPGGEQISILVEERGRVNYGQRLGEIKGLIGPVTVDDRGIGPWWNTPVDLGAVATWATSALAAPSSGRAAWRGTWSLPEATDLFLDTTTLGSGYAVVNGFLLGRYNRTGPQRTLYVPSGVVNAGENTLVIIELDEIEEPRVHFVGEANLGPTVE